MKYITYEIRKLFGVRYIWIFATVLLIANTAIAVYTANQKAARQIQSDIVSDFFGLYMTEPERIETEYAELNALIKERDSILREAMSRRDFDYEPEPLPNKYTDSDKYDDSTLFKEVFSRKDYILKYPSEIQKVIDRAYMNIAEFDAMGVSSESYAYQYQLKVIELYKNAQSNVRMGFEHTRGWGDYFSYDIVNIFIFAILIMFGSAVFAQEKNNGFMAIIRTAKNGRAKTALAKIGAMLILTFAVVLVFTLSTAAVYGAVLGFSNPNNAIQVFSDFLLSPAVLTVGQYFLITIAVKCLVFSLFSCIILMISVFIYNYAIIYICGFGLFGLNFLLYTLSYINAENPFRNLNFVAVAAVNPLFVRYRSLNFFGGVVGYVPFMIAVFGALLIVFSTGTIVAFNNGQTGLNAGRIVILSNIINKVKSLFGNINEKISSVFLHKQSYSLSIFSAETYKTLILKQYIFVVIALLAVKCYISNGEFTAVKSYSDAVYKEYMTTLAGELTDEKRGFIADERAYINSITGKKDEMFEKYLAEEISFDEYREYITEYNYAYSRNELFGVIERHLQYIEQTAEQKNIDAWFVYDTGWIKLFHRSFDVILYALILLLFSGIFADEYTGKSSSGSFAQIMKTTKNGRKRTFFSKIRAALTITVLLTVIFNAVDLLLIFKNYDLPATGAPLASMQSFSAINGGLTIIQYFAIYFLIRLFANLVFAAFVCGLSELLKKTVFVMSVSFAFTLFPALFAYFGLDVFSYFDFTGFLSATQIYLLSARTDLLGDTGLFAIFILCCAVISCGILYKSEKSFIK